MLDFSSNSSGEIEMKSTRMIQAVAVAAVTLMAAAVFVSVVAESSDAYTADPTISDSGFIKDKKAAFYYSKFATSGFAYTGGSVSNDDPEKGVGTVMNDNTVFASISKLDKDKQYFLSIEEYGKSGTLNYGVIATLRSSIITTYVFMSVIDGQPYSEKDALTTVAMAGSVNSGFTAEVTNDIYYVIKLTTDKDAKTDILNTVKVKEPLNFSKICHTEVKVNDLEDEVSNIGKNYGYTSEGKSNYAGAALSYDAGTYFCGFFITNIDKDKLEITVKDSSKIVLDKESIHYGKNVTGSYGYFVLSQDDYPGTNFDKVTVSIGADGKTYASSSSADDKDSNGNMYIVIGVAVIFICAIAITLAYKGDKKEE